jgi:ABC-type sugar transport system substrate-binding protein
MKKLLSFGLAFIMVLSMVACGDTGGDSENDLNEEVITDEETLSQFTAESGYALDSDSFSDKDKTYKLAYIGNAWDFTIQHMVDIMQNIAENELNCEFASVSSNGDADTLITNVENYISQGYDGLIVNVLPSTTGRVNEICEENGIIWSSATGVGRDNDGNLSGPYVCVDDEYVGSKLVDAAVDWSKNNWDDFNDSEAMVFILDASADENLHNRCVSMEARAKELLPNAIVEIGDSMAEGGITAETAYNMTTRRFAANPDVKYWIVLQPFDYFGSGVCRAAEDYNMVDSVCSACCNGDFYLDLLKAGTTGAWRFCLYWDNGVWAQLLINGLYARVSGACPSTALWNDFIQDGEQYAGLRMASIVMGPDNYKDVLGFYDNWLGYEYYGYADDWSGTEYDILDFSIANN